jgi:uncharacterized membrane protein
MSAYIAFANFIMSTALLWAVVQRENGQAVSLKRAYFAGSALIVRLLLLTMLLALMLLPLVIGLLIFGFGVVQPGVSITGGEKVLLILVAFLIAWPSVILLARGIFGVYAIAGENLGPWEAVRRSNQLVRRRLVPVLARQLVLLLAVLLIVAVPVVLTAVTGSSSTLWALILQVAASLLVLSFANIYLYKLYLALK